MRRWRAWLEYLRTVALFFGHRPRDLSVKDAENLAAMAGWQGIIRGVSKGWGETMTVDSVFPSFEDWSGDAAIVPTVNVDPDQLPWS